MAFTQPWINARQITEAERDQLRTDGQWTDFDMAILPATPIATAQFDYASVPEGFTNDQVAVVPILDFTYLDPYDLSDRAGVFYGMTVWVGSAPGLRDIGELRVRSDTALFSDPAPDALNVGEHGDILWITDPQEERYLTVIDDFGLWAVHPTVMEDGVIRMDWEIEYTNQLTVRRAQVNMGAHAVTDLRKPGGDVVTFDARTSWIPGSRDDNADEITAYNWSLYQPAAADSFGDPGYAALDTSTPGVAIITIATPGVYRLMCQIDNDSAGESTTGLRAVRYIFAFGEGFEPFTAFSVEAFGGTPGGGGFSARVGVHGAFADAAGRMRTRALAILCARDYVGGVESTIGQLENRENIALCGYIASETVRWNAEQSTTEFTLESPTGWLKAAGYTWGLSSLLGGELVDTWVEFHELTVLKALWYLYQWRSTAGILWDCYAIDQRGIWEDGFMTGDQGYYDGLSAAEGADGDTWGQLVQFAAQTVLAKPSFDIYGRLHVEIDAQIEPVAYRETVLPVVQHFTDADCAGTIEPEYVPTPAVSHVEIAGVGGGRDEFGGENWQGYVAAYPGKVLARFGDVRRYDGLCLHWDYNNRVGFGTGDPWLFIPELGALLYARDNNPFPVVRVRQPGYNRVLGLAPRQVATMTHDDTATSGIAWVDAGLIPRGVSWEWNPETHGVVTVWTFEGLTDDTMRFSGLSPAHPPEPTGTAPPD